MAEALDLGVAAWGPLAAGLLTGKYTRSDASEPHAGTHRFADERVTALGGDVEADRFEVARAVDAVADELGRLSQHVALAWLRQRPGVVIPILGARRWEQLEQNLSGLDLLLGDDHLRALDAVGAPSLGFLQAFLGSATVRRFSTSGHHAAIDNHRALHYGEFTVD